MRSISKWTLKSQILMLPLLGVVSLLLVQAANVAIDQRVMRETIMPRYDAQILNAHKQTLRAVIDAQVKSLEEKLADVTSREEAQAVIERETDPIRFYDDNSGYIFSYWYDGMRINVPINKAGNGKSFIDLKDAHGTELVRELIAAAQKGGDYVTYYFEKPGAGVKPKLSYAKGVGKWDLLVGAGVYIDNVEHESAALTQTISAQRRHYNVYKTGAIIGVAVLLCAVSLVIVRIISRPIDRVIASLTDGARQVESAASQISTSAQQVAEADVREAASLQHAAQALGEIAAQADANARSASEASQLSVKSRAAMATGDQTVARLNDAMSAINESADQIGKIIRVIEEIAFQTNLLALNAAVEAARAGEHGKGFAVVADEVRSLAMRAATAAQETNTLIATAVGRTKEGTDVAQEVSSALSAAGADVTQVAEHIDQLATTSSAQAGGIKDVSSTLHQIDSVMQSNAASAEESAAAAEELNAQADTLNAGVVDLQSLVRRRR
ncbi:MAG TPA: methyl-accepting chemotaxis protein [Phycisphaerae bacterium]|nr:cache domain-containing protein [Phycisphaerales bacterium]HRX84800.1 methyl-accepting chemotaxis protein [Phycisphaerae bacterium]